MTLDTLESDIIRGQPDLDLHTGQARISRSSLLIAIQASATKLFHERLPSANLFSVPLSSRWMFLWCLATINTAPIMAVPRISFGSPQR